MSGPILITKFKRVSNMIGKWSGGGEFERLLLYAIQGFGTCWVEYVYVAWEIRFVNTWLLKLFPNHSHQAIFLTCPCKHFMVLLTHRIHICSYRYKQSLLVWSCFSSVCKMTNWFLWSGMGKNGDGRGSKISHRLDSLSHYMHTPNKNQVDAHMV